MRKYVSLLVVGVVSCSALFFFSAPAQASTINVSPVNSLTNGLVGYWPMDVRDFTSSNTFLDRSSSGNNETLQGSYTVSNSAIIGKISQALSFDGNATYALHSGVPANMNFQDNTPFTMTAWIKSSYNGASTEAMIATWNFQTTSGWSFGADPAHVFLLIVADSGQGYRFSNSTKTINDGKWHYIVATYDGSGNAANIHFYIDGVLDTTIVQNNTAPGTLTNNQLYIGKIGGPIPEYFNGTLDDIRVYNRVLSSSEIVNLYNAGQEHTQVTPTTYNSSGLVADWNFDGKNLTSTTVVDSSGNGNTGTLENSPTRVTGKTGQALSFNNSLTQYVQLSASASTLNQGSHPYTISTWVKPNDLSACNSDGCGLIRSIGNSGSGQQGDFFLTLSSTGAISFANWQASGDVQSKYSTGNTIPTGKWSHIVAEWDGSTTSVYINGVSQAFNVPLGFTGSGFGSGAYLGAVYTGGAGWMLNGAMDDTRVYSRALSPAEIKQLYNAGQAITQVSPTTYNASGLVGYWPFDGKYTSTTTTQDASGNGNNGTLNNSPTPTIGKIGQALKFNGSNQYVSVVDNSDLNITGNLTVSAWVNTKVENAGQQIVCKGFPNSEYGLFEFGSEYYFRVMSGGGSVFNDAVSTSGVHLGTWIHLVGVYDGQKVRIYVNGVQEASATFTGSIDTHNVSLGIGADSADPANFFHGSIDDVRIYNRALSATEINQLYLAGK